MRLERLKCSYAVFKDIAQTNGFSVCHVVEGSESLTAFCGTSAIIYLTDVGEEQVADYAAAFPTAVVVESPDDAVAQIVGLQTRVYATSDREPVRFVGELFAFPSGTSSHDIDAGKQVRLQSGKFWVDDPALGDRVSLHVIAPDGSIVSTYCDRLPVAPFQAIETLEASTAGLIPAGFKIRVTYERAGAAGCNVGVCLMWLEAGD